MYKKKSSTPRIPMAITVFILALVILSAVKKINSLGSNATLTSTVNTNVTETYEAKVVMTNVSSTLTAPVSDELATKVYGTATAVASASYTWAGTRVQEMNKAAMFDLTGTALWENSIHTDAYATITSDAKIWATGTAYAITATSDPKFPPPIKNK